MKCRNCSTDNADGSKFCTECGVALANKCPKCGHDNATTAKFCGECGNALKAATPTPAAPKAEAPRAAEGERRHLTVLFCDLVGSTEIASRLDAEQWHEIGAAYQKGAAEAVTRFGGYVAKYLGDGLVVYFGYPQALEDAGERAVRAGLAMVDAMRALNARFAKLGVKLEVRVGIHTGSVVVAQGGGQEADMFGDAPNIAARVQSAAEPDTVVITAATHNIVSGQFSVEDKGAHTLKGVPEPVRLYRVTGAGVSRRRSFEARPHTPFVGRDDDILLLERRWSRVRDGEGQLVLVMGEPGIGKSRLLDEFRARLKGEPHLWVQCAGEELHKSTPFHAVTQMLDQALGWRGDESKEERFALLMRGLEAAEVDSGEAAPLIAELLDLPLPANVTPAKFPPEQKRRRLFANLAEWVFGVTKRQPMVIALEDLHWTDPSTVELLQLLAEQGATSRLMLICTTRPEFRASWPVRAHHAQITLNRLNDRQTLEIVAGVAARVGLNPEIVERVIKRTDGVPLFAEELTRLMLDSQRQSGAREIPATLQDSLTARLDRMGSAKEIAQLGSVIGREFSYALLAAVSPVAESELQSALKKLADAELIYVRGFPPEATYQFKHALIQDAAYDALLKTKRRELHGRVAKAIETHFPTIAEAQPIILARHWTDAGETEPAIAAWLKAAQAADARSAFKEADAAYRQAHALLATLPETPERDAREIEILTPLVVAASTAYGWGALELAPFVARTSVLAEKSNNLPQLILQRFAATAAAWQSGDYARCRALADQLLEFATREGSDFSMRCAHEGQIWSRHMVGDFVGEEVHFEAWEQVCARAGFGPFPGETPALLNTAASCAWHRGRSAEAHDRVDRAMASGRGSSNPTDLVTALSGLTTLCIMERNPEACETAAAEGVAIAEKNALPNFATILRFALNWARANLHGGDEATAAMRRETQAMLSSGERQADATLRLAQALNEIGQLEEALATVDRFLTTFNDYVIVVPTALALRGDVLAKLGRKGAAEASLRDAIEAAHKIGTKPPELRAATTLARIWREAGKRDEARDLLQPIYAYFTDGFDTRDLIEAKAELDALANA